MKTMNNNKTLIWIIVILIATNISTIGSFYYHRISEAKTIVSPSENQEGIPGEQRTRYFREQLVLQDEQVEQFRTLNRTFNQTARGIEIDLSQLRVELIAELGKENSDTVKLGIIAGEIGAHHRKLKEVTSTFYLEMKEICNKDQQAKLHEIFQSMLNQESQVNLPQPGNQGGRWRNK